MAAAMHTMNVQVPPGSGPGQFLQATSPEGITVQVQVPPGKTAGSTFPVQYPVASYGNTGNRRSNDFDGERPQAPMGLCRLRTRDIALICLFIFIAVALTTGGQGYNEGRREHTRYIIVNGATVHHHIVRHSAIIVLTVLAVWYDWTSLGPTVALQHGVMAGVIAWIIVVPLGVFLGVTSVLLVYVVALIAILGAIMLLGPVGCVVGIFLAVGLVVVGVFFEALLQGSFGEIVVFVCTYFAVRTWTGNVPGLQSMDKWPYIHEVDQRSQEYQQQIGYFNSCCQQWEHKFDFSLVVMRLYRVDKPGAMTVASAGTPKLLFHGTPWEAAKGIICDGFRMPAHAGMFGKGLYFADCPLKSWRYCFRNRQLSEMLPKMFKRGGLILMCYVDLGQIREEKEARPEMKGYDRKGWKAWFTRQKGAYDSVKAVDHEEGGAVRVPEYIVYKPEQVQVAYMWEVNKGPRPRSASSSSANNNG